MRPSFSALLLSTLSLAAFTAAQAGALANGAWAPANCGTKPVAPQLDLKNPDAFNRSVVSVNAYRQSIRPYLDCLVQEGNADIQAISKSVTAAQQAAKETNDKIQADVKAADEKFK
jgi:hypothetical protein